MRNTDARDNATQTGRARKNPIFSKNTPLILKLLLFAAAFILYFNIGWLCATYYATYIINREPQTFWQVIWAGGFQIMSNPNHPPSTTLAWYYLGWPILASMWLASWIAFFLWEFCLFVFDGGLMKILGITNLLGL